ncbi:MAG: YciI family protein [Flavobacteriaceae bacterium]|nr:YciI family protein [Flavobacteriaceae bacterium]
MNKFVLIFVLACTMAISTFEKITAQEIKNKGFDKKLATELNADEYGMKKYVMAFLKKGPNRDLDSITRSKLQRAHLDNIIKMADDGDLVLAGPFLEDTELRGIYIFNVETIEAAKKLTETDPLIQSGGLIMELHTWYGSAALQAIGNIHKTIQKKGI